MVSTLEVNTFFRNKPLYYCSQDQAVKDASFKPTCLIALLITLQRNHSSQAVRWTEVKWWLILKIYQEKLHRKTCSSSN